MVDLNISEALPELSEEKQKAVERFVKSEMEIKNHEDLARIIEEDLIKNNLLTPNQAALLVNYWSHDQKLPDNWDELSSDLWYADDPNVVSSGEEGQSDYESLLGGLCGEKEGQREDELSLLSNNSTQP